jgi:hypothetical protein
MQFEQTGQLEDLEETIAFLPTSIGAFAWISPQPIWLTQQPLTCTSDTI